MDQSKSLSVREELASIVLRLRSKGLCDVALIAALEQTPRRSFVHAQWVDIAYKNTVIPIECGEYIERLDEQLMVISALNLAKKHRVLEVGTGSGYTTALMARLAGRVTTMERYKQLCDLARQRFHQLKLDNIVLRQMDGSRAVSGSGPFDRIVMWCSMPEEPQQFLDLLSSEGTLIAAIGPNDASQTLVRYVKTGSRFERMDMFKVRFQPFIEGVSAKL